MCKQESTGIESAATVWRISPMLGVSPPSTNPLHSSTLHNTYIHICTSNNQAVYNTFSHAQRLEGTDRCAPPFCAASAEGTESTHPSKYTALPLLPLVLAAAAIWETAKANEKKKRRWRVWKNKTMLCFVVLCDVESAINNDYKRKRRERERAKSESIIIREHKRRRNE